MSKKQPKKVERFIVRHYVGDEWPTIEGNGFDGLTIGETREEAEAFVAWLNDKLAFGRDLGEPK